MPLDPHTEELLMGYPDQLDDSQLAELRSLAKDDLLVAAMMDSVHEAEALLRSGAETVEMSEQGLALLREVVVETLGDADMTVEDLMAPLPQSSTEPEEELSPVPGDAERAALDVVDTSPRAKEEGEAVVSLADRRSSRSIGPVWQALAAVLVLGIGYGLWGGGLLTPETVRPGGDGVQPGAADLRVRGGDTPDLSAPPTAGDSSSQTASAVEDPVAAQPPRSELVVRTAGDARSDEDDGRLRSGAQRSVRDPIQFEAVLREPRSLALVEAEADGKSWVVYPAPGALWDVGSGVNILHPEAAPSPEFLPKASGLVSYILVGAAPSTRLLSGEGGAIEGLGSFLAAYDAEVIDRLEIRWVDPE